MSDGGWSLKAVSEGLTAAANRREERRQEINRRLEERGPAVFEKDPDGTPGHGIGWFLSDDGQHYIAYRRMSNGYQDYPCQTMSVAVLRQLVEKL